MRLPSAPSQKNSITATHKTFFIEPSQDPDTITETRPQERRNAIVMS